MAPPGLNTGATLVSPLRGKWSLKQAVVARAAELLDPGMFVGGHALARELSAQPVGLFYDHHAFAHPCGGERSGETAHASPQNYYVRVDLAHSSPLSFVAFVSFTIIVS
jgi:hypothetical protein